MAITTPYFLAVDLETTGLDPKRDQILEIGLAFVHAQTLEIIEEASWVLPTVIKTLPNATVLEMHAASGLWREVEEACTKSRNVDGMGYALRALIAEIRRWYSDRAARDENGEIAPGGPMLGSSVHFDRAFLAEHFPKLLSMWNYRNLDASTVKTCVKAWCPEVEIPKPDKAHRALADIRASVELLKFCRAQAFVLPQSWRWPVSYSEEETRQTLGEILRGVGSPESDT